MRIIAGESRGIILVSPSDDKVRPTPNRIREALFSILGSFEDCTVFDAFAGTGALGCEALSRGATQVAFADSATTSIELITENVKRVHGTERSQILKGTYAFALTKIAFEPDIVFLDPPYNQGLTNQALEVMASASPITKGCLVIAEQHVDEEPCANPAFELDDERIYGSIRLRFFVRKELSEE